jgi:tetratricopeptide (TPR) repeat protein
LWAIAPSRETTQNEYESQFQSSSIRWKEVNLELTGRVEPSEKGTRGVVTVAKKKAKTKKKSHGFGESQIPTRSAKDFIVALGKKEGDKRELFLTANLEKLDESLLDALPLVFENLTKGQSIDHRRAIAGLFVRFSNLLCQFSKGTRWLNLELAIAAYESALRIFTREDFPQEWATTQMNLGNAYSDRIRGERAENLEAAIAAYNRALQIFTREDFPQDWARTQMNLGIAYLYRIRGERAENLEEAIATYNRALQICRARL